MGKYARADFRLIEFSNKYCSNRKPQAVSPPREVLEETRAGVLMVLVAGGCGGVERRVLQWGQGQGTK